MYPYQQQQQYSPPPPAAPVQGQYGQQYGQPAPVSQGYPGAGASPYAGSSSDYPGQQAAYGQPQQHQHQYSSEPSYGGVPSTSYSPPPPAPAPAYGGGYASSPPPPVAAAPPQNLYNQQQQQHQQPPSYQQPQSQYSHSYSPPPQAPPVPPSAPALPYNLGSDPNVFRGYLTHELKQLTFNSKPIINGLTILAHENAARMAPVVCQCLEEHIRQTHPSTKLPAMYLLDSICKNIGPPYTTLFSRTIDRIFLSAYHDVDPPTKVKLEELLGTWRTGGQDHGELFKLPPNAPLGTLPPQRIIEEALFPRPAPPVPMPPPVPPYANGGQAFNRQSPPPPLAPAAPQPDWTQQRVATPPVHGSDPTNLEKAEILYDIRKLLELRRSQVHQSPNNRGVFDQINTLKQLELLVTNTVLGPAQIAQIRAQLAKINPEKARRPTPPLPKIEPRGDGFDMRGGKRQRLMSPTQVNYPNRGTPPPGVFDLAALTSRLNPDIIRTASAQGTRASATPPPVGAPASGLQPPPAHLPANPLSKLANSSLPGSATPPTIATNIAQFKMLNENAFGAYEHHRVHFTVQLQSSDIARYRPGAHALLYDAMPLRCGQCGNRYLDCPLGKERLDRDLDRHLRISRRYTESTGAQRGIARSWFTVEEEWVLPPSKIQPSAAVIQAENAKKKAENYAELLNKHVLVPPAAATDEELSHCPICKEAFKNEYSEEEEDWVWRNCVEVDGKYYHASCRAEEDV